MTTPVTVSGRDLRVLAAIVSEDRPDLPDGKGLPLSLLADLMGQIRCDGICFMGFDSGRHKTWVLQAMPAQRRTTSRQARIWIWRIGRITGTASPAATPTVPVMCAVS